MLTAEEEAIFAAARDSVDRGAWSRWCSERGISRKDPRAAAAHEEWRRSPLLLRPALQSVARKILGAALGGWRTGDERFPAEIWTDGATHTDGSRPFLGTMRDFAERILVHRASVVAPKRTGWVLEPTTNPAGRRTNECTVAMHALFLDCDGTGEWHRTLEVLRGLGLAHVAYQSGGWTPTEPKWRLVLPLNAPHDTTAETGRESWKAIYNCARVAFGSVGELLGPGFDPATDTPCCPWFLTERRAPQDPPRQIVWQPGHAIDLVALAAILPAKAESRETGERAPVETISIAEEHFERIVDALSASTAHVPMGRRDIYLAMPAVLLNRGVAPDDVRAIVAEVSSRYPRQHADKHADNMHCVETTITRWEREGSKARITQIGTLQALAPEVAAALDEVLPDPGAEILEEAVTRSLEMVPAVKVGQSARALPQPTAPRGRRGKLSPLKRKLASVAKRLQKNRVSDRRVEGILIACAVSCVPLPQDGPDGVNALACKLARALGYNLPTDVPWLEALDVMAPTLMGTVFMQSVELVAAAERAFWEGRGSANRGKMKREKRRIAEQEKMAERARNTL